MVDVLTERARRRATHSAPLLRAVGISKTYRTPDHIGRLVLERVDFTLRDGEIVAILGKSGAGKSTFLRILAGLVEPSEGRVEYRGMPVDRTGARGCDGVPELRAVSLADRARQCRTGSRGAGRSGRRAAAARGRRDRPDRARRVRERLSEGAVGRHAAARRLRPRARRRTRTSCCSTSRSRSSTC